MDFLAALFANPSLKRAGVGAVTAAIISLNQKLGLGLQMEDKAALVTLAVAFLSQSAWKEVRIAGADAATKVSTIPAALALLSSVPPK